VSFPLYARMIRDGRQNEVASVVAHFSRVLLVVVGGMYIVLILLADHIVLLGDRWAPAVPALKVLCAYGLGLSLLTLWYETIIVSGRLRHYLCLEIGHLVLLVILLLVFTTHGITAVALAQVGAVWALTCVVWVTLVRARIAPPFRDMVRGVTGFAVPALGCVALAVLARWADIRAEPASLPGAVFELLVLAVCYVTIAALTNRSLLVPLLRRRKTESL
jgi:O-antigen/teichoic acid export membrane protein